MDAITMLQSIVTSSLMFSAPLILTAIAGTFSERSGVINIGLEGIMVMGAFASAIFNLQFYEIFGKQTPWIAMLVGGAVGLIFSVLHAVATINLRADHIVSGTAINLLAPALAVFLVRVLFDKAQTGPLATSFGITSIPILKDIPIIGEIFFTSVTPLGYMGIIIGVIGWFVLFKTPFGLRLRSVGEHPVAAETVGINVRLYKYAGVLISGFLGGMGGAIQAQAIANEFGALTIAGQGFMAMAAMIFGKWNPIGVTFAAIFFGFAQSLSRVGRYIPIIQDIPTIYLQVLPYVLTIVILVGFIGKSEAPESLGETYIKSE
ncbi:MAG: ABC transporter permease [Atopostipes sp.]|nr:ABC transporter permease [Atopostipes sp.]